MFKTILICSDGSDHALKAAKQAVETARLHQACVVLLHVESTEFQPLTVPWQLEIGESAPPHLTAQHRANLDATIALCKEARVVYRCRHAYGHAAEQIIRAAEEEEADLIVIGSRGLSEWKALLLGSVSDHVLHHAHCSVLIVR
jgi:nucleotide-binding universal stress UspA family protein